MTIDIRQKMRECLHKECHVEYMGEYSVQFVLVKAVQQKKLKNMLYPYPYGMIQCFLSNGMLQYAECDGINYKPQTVKGILEQKTILLESNELEEGVAQSKVDIEITCDISHSDETVTLFIDTTI